MSEKMDLQNSAATMERVAVLRAMDRTMRDFGVPGTECMRHIMETCISLGAEMFVRMHPDIEETALASLFGEMAQEAVTAYYDAQVVVFAQHSGVKEVSHA
jgi:ketopantoate reductase